MIERQKATQIGRRCQKGPHEPPKMTIILGERGVILLRRVALAPLCELKGLQKATISHSCSRIRRIKGCQLVLIPRTDQLRSDSFILFPARVVLVFCFGRIAFACKTSSFFRIDLFCAALSLSIFLPNFRTQGAVIPINNLARKIISSSR